MAKILLIEDDLELLNKVSLWLQYQLHVVEKASTGKQAEDMLVGAQYELIVMDWELPEISGVDLIDGFRKRGGQTPILMLTGKSAIDDKVQGFRAGADDYLTKPFELQELLVRVEALLRRPRSYTGTVIEVGSMRLDTQTHSVQIAGTDVHLQPKEFAVLEFFVRHPRQTFSAEALLDHVWHSDDDVTVDSVRTCIKKLRKKLFESNCDVLIDTVHKIGYQLLAP